ncbi:hypothetical protein GH714_010965 [Hevea brasiliensis]|uniref:Kinesin-like protein n=1 Tax=Hevea brasiliensis TaxID=3981 RepID=A0A6A6NGE4_HEVBR|nr:hypothetical protein GH714_010965 [Hevea brasiliensis]
MSDREFLIRVSYMEIYNEEINDLFAVENQKLQIHESLEEEIVNNAEQVLELIATGEVNRHFGETNMNIRSSRSHTIFRMVIESKGKDSNSSTNYSSSDAIRVSVLNLVDLAGSERIAKTGAGGVRLKEGKHINKSLMALGNVINKLSDGPKQRGHIPYRDSKLTRILQPALGGNAKTSIICTIAPEEVHIDETKGTLQFASRAKRITNCAQVNEILTDAALLKRQKLEIEELRKKLQGSRGEVLEQEILKLRNEMLKYELEREKLEMQLEEERKSHKERDQCIREQQMRIDNLSNLVTFPECDKNAGQMHSNHHLNLIVIIWTLGLSSDNHRKEVENLTRQLELITEEKNELERKHSEQSLLNEHLMEEISELKQEVLVIGEIPQRLGKSVAHCKEIFKDLSLTMQSFVPDDESSTAKLLSSTSEIVISLFSNLESYLFMDKDNHEFFPRNDSLVQEHCKVLSESIRGTITSLVASEKLAIQNKEVKNTICGCDRKAVTDRKLQRQCIEDSKQHSPVSVLEEVASHRDEPEYFSTVREKNPTKTCAHSPKKVTEDSILSASLWKILFHSATEKSTLPGVSEIQELVHYNLSSQHLKSKSALQQTRQLLFDCVKEIVENQGRKEKQQGEYLEAEELGKLIGEKIKLWGKQSGENHLRRTNGIGISGISTRVEWL